MINANRILPTGEPRIKQIVRVENCPRSTLNKTAGIVHKGVAASACDDIVANCDSGPLEPKTVAVDPKVLDGLTGILLDVNTGGIDDEVSLE